MRLLRQQPQGRETSLVRGDIVLGSLVLYVKTVISYFTLAQHKPKSIFAIRTIPSCEFSKAYQC